MPTIERISRLWLQYQWVLYAIVAGLAAAAVRDESLLLAAMAAFVAFVLAAILTVPLSRMARRRLVAFSSDQHASPSADRC